MPFLITDQAPGDQLRTLAGGKAHNLHTLTAAGTLQDYTSSDDDIDRELKQISQGTQVDDELAKIKAEVGSGEQPKEISS